MKTPTSITNTSNRRDSPKVQGMAPDFPPSVQPLSYYPSPVPDTSQNGPSACEIEKVSFTSSQIQPPILSITYLFPPSAQLLPNTFHSSLTPPLWTSRSWDRKSVLQLGITTAVMEWAPCFLHRPQP